MRCGRIIRTANARPTILCSIFSNHSAGSQEAVFVTIFMPLFAFLLDVPGYTWDSLMDCASHRIECVSHALRFVGVAPCQVHNYSTRLKSTASERHTLLFPPQNSRWSQVSTKPRYPRRSSLLSQFDTTSRTIERDCHGQCKVEYLVDRTRISIE